jgi:hypothetical protein
MHHLSVKGARYLTLPAAVAVMPSGLPGKAIELMRLIAMQKLWLVCKAYQMLRSASRILRREIGLQQIRDTVEFITEFTMVLSLAGIYSDRY